MPDDYLYEQNEIARLKQEAMQAVQKAATSMQKFQNQSDALVNQMSAYRDKIKKHLV